MNISVPENHLKLHFERVSKSFGDLSVIDRFDNTIADGEIIALVGPSGCGKSTLLHRVAGLEHALYPWMTLLENVAVALEFQGQPAEYARNEASIWLDRVKLVGFEEYFTRIRSPAACASAAPWPARSSSGPRCCCSMNPSALWTP